MNLSHFSGLLRAGVLAGLAVGLAIGLSACGKKKPAPLPPPTSGPISIAEPMVPKPVVISPLKTSTNTAKWVVQLTTNVPVVAPLAPPPAAAVTNAALPLRTITNPPPAAKTRARGSNTNQISQIEKGLDIAFKALEQNKPGIAVGLFTAVLQRDPTNQRGRFGLSAALIQTDKYKEALAILEQMAKESPKNYVLKNNIAWVYATACDLSMRNGPRAIQLAQEALLLNTLDCHVWSTLAEAYFISGRYDKALRNAEHALQLGRDTNADPKLLEEYQRQMERCRKAAESMAIME